MTSMQGVMKIGNSNTLVFRYRNQHQESKKSDQCNRDGVNCTSHFHMWYLAAFLCRFKDLGQAGSSFGSVWLRAEICTTQVREHKWQCLKWTYSTRSQVKATKLRPQRLGSSGDTPGHRSCMALNLRVRSIVWPLFWPWGPSLLLTN